MSKKNLDTKSNQPAEWENHYITSDSSSTIPLNVTYTNSPDPADLVLNKIIDVENRLTKIELALAHVIPHVLEKLDTEN